MNPVLLAIISAALFGASAPAGKSLSAFFSAYQLAGLLYLGAALGTLPVIVRNKGNAFFKVHKSSRAKLFGVLLCGGCAAPAYMFALSIAPASVISMYLSLESPFTAVLAAMIFKEHLGKLGVIGVIGTTISAVLLSYGEGSAGVLAALAAAAACLLWSLDNNLTATIDGITPAQVTFWKGLIAGSVNLALGSLLQPLHATAGAFLYAIAIGAFCYGLSITLYISSAQKLGATRSQMIFASTPFWGVVISALTLGERLSFLQAGAGAILIASIIVLMRDLHAHRHKHEEMSHTHEHSHDDGHHNHVHEGEPASLRHTHWHTHETVEHSHPHWPDLHHRHSH